ncbi:hypothetical protein [Kordiimonas gwangyangensis]|uniref:hypothetical protein n=1 Tax=Kordiimonas gwangyangensis TaxID=288022 RepID=UPI0003AA40A1|nr:hypothetical protein [Kordiimonas gwangyangensis]
MNKIACILGLLVLGSPAAAQTPSSAIIDDQVLAQIREWLVVPVVSLTLEAQNERYTDLGSADIDRLDTQWRAEREAKEQPLIASTLNNPLSTYLTQVQAASAGLFTEIFVIDAKGLNAGQSSITSDFWQGDEAKFQKTYDVGPGAVFIDDPEFHDPTGTWRAQANLTLMDTSGQSIGAATVEVNLTELARRKAIKKGAN